MSEPTNTLPPLYSRWVDELLGAPAPAEPRVTCHACPMCPDDEGRPRNVGVSFSPRVKCCTYYPPLANFLVGRILADPDPAAAAGRASVEARIDAGRTVTPFGMSRPLDRPGLEADHAAMGHSERLRCPHYVDEDGGICGVWNHRQAICATWFCKHERGAFGFRAWKGLEELLSAVENELAVWCTTELDVDHQAIVILLELAKRGPELDAPAPAVYAARWGGWAGREREFFMECARLVDALSWTDVLAHCGALVSARAAVVRTTFEAAADRSVPERLMVGPHQTVATSADGSFVTTYSPYNPLAVSTLMGSVLHYFDGRPTAEALAAIKAERGLEIDPEYLRSLIDYDVLREVAG